MSEELAKQLSERQERPKYQSLGGWLILPAIGLVALLVRTLAELIKAIETVVGSKAWTILTTPGTPEYHPNWAPLIVYELCYYCLILAVGVVLAVCFEKKKRFVPSFFIVFLSANLLLSIGEYAFLCTVPATQEQLSEVIRCLEGVALACMIWIPYFLVSKRVKATFVR